MVAVRRATPPALAEPTWETAAVTAGMAEAAILRQRNAAVAAALVGILVMVVMEVMVTRGLL